MVKRRNNDIAVKLLRSRFELIIIMFRNIFLRVFQYFIKFLKLTLSHEPYLSQILIHFSVFLPT